MGIPIVEKIVAIDKERISLLHPDIAKCLQRVGRLKEIGTIAIHIGAVMPKDHLSHQYLGIRIDLLIEGECVGMFEKDLSFRRLHRIDRCDNGCICLLCA